MINGPVHCLANVLDTPPITAQCGQLGPHLKAGNRTREMGTTKGEKERGREDGGRRERERERDQSERSAYGCLCNC